ncbi:putative MFS transporter [Microdochium trichocladiopsis]|uniref:MFS transporter n=1 Tax=Microdochium trichocladiopsis TaxID=1682393 RepID=A0A9P8Y5S3_9PEZI|nr:putative MFS transporter [Microdochium trichocladiopsis]KAH7029884.1 putative MFS transporter [Microdochium trichocladiopsis]
MPKEDLTPSHVSAVDADLNKDVADYTNGEHVIPKPESFRDMSPEELQKLEKKMVRKMDAVILPIMGVLYILNYVDRNALAATKVYGIMDDLNMNTQQFATVIAILFVGYIPFQIPSNMLMTKVTRPGLYLCLAATVWGAISTCTAAVNTYEAMLGVRILLGITEAAFFPGILYYLSAWYTKKEIGKRYAALFMFQMVGSAFGGFIAAACLTLEGAHGIRGWRWLFIVEGAATVGCGLIFACIMPEFPHKARLLKPVERDYAVWRLEVEAGVGEAHEDVSTRKGFALAFKDGKIWALVAANFATQSVGSTNNLFPSIVSTLGYNSTNTLLLTAPPFVLAAIIFWFTMAYSDKANVIYPILMANCGWGLLVYIVAAATTNTGARYFTMMFMPTVCTIPQIMYYKTVNLHMARPFPKRAAGVAMINAIGGLANLYSSYLWYSAPHFYVAFGVLLGMMCAIIVIMTAYRFHVLKLNKLLDGTHEQQQMTKKAGVTQQQIDLGWRFIGY